ncbi:MAG: helix-turn-helix transcriptional regulator [Lachnospiraceae bacterium]|nr:helix-turn-helix transcriptional regulator [Lachnospiraceae bacterium]
MGSLRDNISSNIAYYRKLNKLTQKELGEKLGVKSTTVSNWEQGANAPDMEILFDLCKLFNISVTDVFGCDSIESDNFHITPEEKDIVIAYRVTDEIGKESVKRLLGVEKRDSDQMKGIS